MISDAVLTDFNIPSALLLESNEQRIINLRTVRPLFSSTMRLGRGRFNQRS